LEDENGGAMRRRLRRARKTESTGLPMQRKSKGWVWLLLVVALGFVAVLAWGRLRGPDVAQAAAISLLRQNLRPTHGLNAAPALWFASRDVPADQRDALYARDRQRMQMRLAAMSAEGLPSASFIDIAPTQQLPPMSSADKALTCGAHDVDCLAHTSKNREPVRALLSRQQQRLHNQQALAHDDHDWNEMPVNVEVAIPAYGAGHYLWLTSAALDFVDGNATTALESVCTNAFVQRRLHAHSNTLIGTMVADAELQAASNLFLHMLAQLPTNQALPESCDQAFTAVEPADANMCASMQWEFHLYDSFFETAEKVMPWWQKLLYVQSASQRFAAPDYAKPCTDSVRAKLLADDRFNSSEFPQLNPDWIDRIANPFGNKLLALGQFVYTPYLNRHEDANAVLRLVATVLWLRQTHGDGRTMVERLAQRPTWMQMGRDRQLQVTADGSSIHMGYHGPGAKWPTEWPLPGGL
jgi:hypothetical protein